MDIFEYNRPVKKDNLTKEQKEFLNENYRGAVNVGDKICCDNCIYENQIHYDGNDEEMDMDDDKCMECTNYDCFEQKENK